MALWNFRAGSARYPIVRAVVYYRVCKDCLCQTRSAHMMCGFVACVTSLTWSKYLKQPGLRGGEGANAPKGVPDGQRAANQLVASGRVHGVDAHVGAAQPNRPLRGERASGVVFRDYQAMPACKVTICGICVLAVASLLSAVLRDSQTGTTDRAVFYSCST